MQPGTEYRGRGRRRNEIKLKIRMMVPYILKLNNSKTLRQNIYIYLLQGLKLLLLTKTVNLCKSIN